MRVFAAAFLTLLACATARAAPIRVTCADRFHKPPYNTSGDPSQNNVPIDQCYKISTSGQCVYNLRRPASYADRRFWNAICPSNVAGPYCCGWTATICCFAMDPLRPCPGFPLNGSIDLCKRYFCKWDFSSPGCSAERANPKNAR